MTRKRIPVMEQIPVIYSDETTPPHWACPDCGQPCYCLDPIVRGMPHMPCRIPEEVAA